MSPTEDLLRHDMPWYAPVLWLAGLLFVLPVVDAIGWAVIGTTAP